MKVIARSLLLAAFAILIAAPSAQATFPGGNGKFWFVDTGGTWTMDPDGGNASLIFEQKIVGPWSADGKMMVREAAYPSQADFEVWRDDGTKVTDISVPGDGVAPSWTPDGKIVYVSNELVCEPPTEPLPPNCNLVEYGIRVINLDGTGDYQVLPSGSHPAWSPDGSKLAYVGFASLASLGTDIFVAGADGSNPHPITHDDAFDLGPDWAPDSSRIGYSKTYATCGEFGCGTNSEVMSIAADGTDERRLTNSPLQEGSPIWSPDASKLMFDAVTADRTAYAGTFVMNADGTGVTKIRDSTIEGPYWQPLVSRGPDCSGVHATPGSLWPPNHKLFPVSLSGAGDGLTVTIAGVTGGPAVLGPAADQASLRADKGSTYRIAFSASDGNGGTCTGEVDVAVTHRG